MTNSVTRRERLFRAVCRAVSVGLPIVFLALAPSVNASASDPVAASRNDESAVPLKLDGRIADPSLIDQPQGKTSLSHDDTLEDSSDVDSQTDSGLPTNDFSAPFALKSPVADPGVAPSADADQSHADSGAQVGSENSVTEPGSNADGDTSTAPPALDNLPQIMSKVWRDNPQVLQAQQALLATGYDITAARAGYLPYAQIQTALANNSQDSVSTLYVVLPLWSGGSTGAQVDLAKAKQKAALAALVQKRLDLGHQTLEVYFNIVQAQDQMIQWHNYIGALKKLLTTIDRRASKGAAPQADVETAVSRLRQAQASMEANRALLLSSRAQLASLLDAQPGSLAWPGENDMLNDEELAADKDRIKLHPTHLTAQAQVDVQKGQAHFAEASLWPELSLQHRRQLDGVKFDPSNDATLFVLSYQTTNGVQGLFGYRAERQRIAAVEAQLTAADRDVASTLAVDKTQLTATAAQLQVQYEASQSASALVDSFIRQFEAGRKSWLEVLNAQREANDSLLQSIVVRRNYWYASEKLALDGMYWNRFGAKVIGDTGNNAGK